MADDLNPTGETCPHCGSAINPWGRDEGWVPTDNIRLVPDGEETIITGRIPAGGLFPRMADVHLTGRTVKRDRVERMWIRRWGQSEWRAD